MKSSKLPGMLSVKSKKGLDYMDMILKTTALCKNFKGQMAVNNVSLNIRRNSVYGLLGPNGAGKSTILKMLTGILRPTSGSIEFDGHPWKRNDLEHIGALIEMPPLYENLTAYENLKVRTTLLGLDDARINEVLQIVQLTNTGKKRAGQFSLGMKQRLGIAIALLNSPQLLILDEPTNGLDPLGIEELRELFCQKSSILQIMWVSLLAASLDMRESFAPVKIWNNSLWMLFAEMVRRDIKWRWHIFRQRT